MILNSSETKIVASCGWVEKSSLLVICPRERKEERLKIGEAGYIGLKKLPQDYFLAIQHYPGEYVVLSIHSFQNPAEILAEVIATSRNLKFRGDDSLWKLAPKYYVGGLNDESEGRAYRLIEMNRERKEELFPDLEWWDKSYDKMYQGVIDVIEIPNTDYLLFSVQRDSEPVLYDISGKKVTKKIKLAGRRGNPIFTFRNNQKELWCIDYDTLVKIRLSDWKILAKKRMQGSILQMDMLFVGDFSFTADEKYCAVARPYSRDLVLLRCDPLKVVANCGSRFQPLSVAVLSNLDYVARNWKTGQVEYGSFKLKKKFWPFG